MKNKNVGRFQISLELLEREPYIVRCILSRVIVTRAETLHHIGAIEYIAISDEFSKVPEGNKILDYIVKISENTGVTFVECPF